MQYAREHHFPNPTFFVDDGVSGVTYDRPGFQAMLAEIEAGRVAVAIAKDLSRLGRNSALTGLYTNFTFPQNGVRFIAINDNYDTIDPIIPALGKYPINKIGTSMMENFVSNKLTHGRLDGNGGLSPKTMSDMLTIIKESFKYAQVSGALTVCRFDGICFKQNAQEMRVLSVFEQQQLLSVLFDDFDRYKMGVFICLYTGIRIGELCALQWRDISFNEKVIVIGHTMQRLQNDDPNALNKTKIIITAPKSKASLRTIPLPDFVVHVIKPLAGLPSAYILSGECKTMIEPRTMQNKFKGYLDKGQISDANFHSLRHTFATRCIEAGFDIKTLSEILGHSSVKITLDRYVHSSMELKRSNMEKLTPITV